MNGDTTPDPRASVQLPTSVQEAVALILGEDLANCFKPRAQSVNQQRPQGSIAHRRRNSAAYGTSPVKRYRRTQAELAEIDAAIHDVAEAEQPVSVRGIFYRVMSRGLVPKSEQGYKVVQRQALKLRRGGVLPYDWITDGSRLRLKPQTWHSAEGALLITAASYRRALWADQSLHVEVWSEKDAIRGAVLPITEQYDVPLMIAKGFPSDTFLYETAAEITDDGKPAIIYQLGDHDPSGVSAWEDTKRKLRSFIPAHIELTFERLAVTPEQIDALELPTRPTKQSDSRAAKFVGDSVEVDAIPTPTLRRIVADAIERWIDPEALSITKHAERSEKQILQRIAGRWDDELRDYAEGYAQ